MSIKAIFLPGNGGGTTKDNWFPYLKKELEGLVVKVIDTDFPDQPLCRAEHWLPFLENLGADENTILIGHSTGAIAAMKFAQNHNILGSVLVGGYHTDMGDEMEIKSQYFDTPWDWEKIKKNQKWVIQFNSTDDPWIPIEEARFIQEKLGSEYYEFKNSGHFGGDREYPEFPELVEALKKKL